MAGIYFYSLTMLANWEVPVKTQASVIACRGLLAKIRDVNLTLISVIRVKVVG